MQPPTSLVVIPFTITTAVAATVAKFQTAAGYMQLLAWLHASCHLRLRLRLHAVSFNTT